MAEFTLLNLHLRLSLHVISIQLKSLLMNSIFRGRGSGFGLENKRAMIQANFSSNATMIGKARLYYQVVVTFNCRCIQLKLAQRGVAIT